MPSPASKPITMVRGDDYSLFFRVTKKVWNAETGLFDSDYEDFTGWTGAAQLRATVDDTEFLAFTIEFADQAVTPGAGFMTMGHVLTETIDFEAGIYDAQLTAPDGLRTTFFGGAVVIKKDVTRP